MENEFDAHAVSEDDETFVSADDESTPDDLQAQRQAWSISSRDQLVCQHLHLVHSVARRFSGLGESLDDLIQEGTIGLLKAVDLFDPERGVKFSTYACHQIGSQIQHYLRDRGRLIRQPAWVQELNAKVVRATESLFQELGRDPLVAEIAERLELPEATVSHALSSRELNSVVSLSTPSDNAGESDLSLLDKDKSLTEKLTAFNLPIEDRLILDEAIGTLKTLEQSVVRLFFYEDLNQSEIARKLSISANYSSYLLRRSTAKLKTILEQQHTAETAALTREAPIVPAFAGDLPTYDRQTGLYTSVYLRARVAEEIERGRRYPTNFALLMLSVAPLPADPLQQRQAILAISQFLRKSTRIVDMIAHLEQGTFALLLPHTGREARVLGQRLSSTIRNLPPSPAISSASIALAFGFSVFPMDGMGLEALYRRADAALKAALTTES